jgi:hypothetical protein
VVVGLGPAGHQRPRLGLGLQRLLRAHLRLTRPPRQLLDLGLGGQQLRELLGGAAELLAAALALRRFDVRGGGGQHARRGASEDLLRRRRQRRVARQLLVEAQRLFAAARLLGGAHRLVHGLGAVLALGARLELQGRLALTGGQRLDGEHLGGASLGRRPAVLAQITARLRQQLLGAGTAALVEHEQDPHGQRDDDAAAGEQPPHQAAGRHPLRPGGSADD